MRSLELANAYMGLDMAERTAVSHPMQPSTTNFPLALALVDSSARVNTDLRRERCPPNLPCALRDVRIAHSAPAELLELLYYHLAQRIVTVELGVLGSFLTIRRCDGVGLDEHVEC